MDIKDVTKNILRNYNENVGIYIQLLKDIDCNLVYCDKGLENCIYERTVYACSIQYVKKNKKKKLRSVLPIMIGSKLDIAIRKYNLTQIDSLENIPDVWDTEFQTADIAITCFLINGTLKQIPFFITNDATNPHIVKNSIVRLYRYDSNEKGKELSLYFDNMDGFDRGSLVVRLNDGNHTYDLENFFDCPYPVDTKTYFERIFQQVIGQAVRGRSRGGGMSYGTMETLNGGIGTGIPYATEEIIGEHSDRIANFYKCNIEYDIEPPVLEM
ncbi:RNA_pol_Rpb2_6 domain-containing protein [Nephila pilipes]|uniref:RNA_pol_Rpb2_6 domain-containing protein n=1 Tax=Nephila pilipes TaxID=299642 RepID=A0A8X6T9E3_NEPPI|nr:RNA_pol_Rpb2_6 domain-containing protein [Nephila pilipes]